MVRKSNKVPVSTKMINRPTVVPASANNVGCNVGTDTYFAIQVDTTGVAGTAPVEIVLFDASMGYQLANKTGIPAGVTITGVTANYQFILNDVAHNASFVDIIKQLINDESKAMTQYDFPIEIYSSSKGSAPKLVATYHPSKGVHEGQFQKAINTFEAPILIDNRIAFVFKQQPGIIQTFGFYQKAEVGRKQ